MTVNASYRVGRRGVAKFVLTALALACASWGAFGQPEADATAMATVQAGERTSDAPLPVTQQQAALGQRLFFDRRLSQDGTVSCASCHQPDKYFSDGLRTSHGVHQLAGSRNAPSLLNASLNTSQFWEGRVRTLEEQALRPFVNPREMALPNPQALLKRVAADAGYASAFASAFGPSDAITLAHLANAIASYERTLNLADSLFDRHLAARVPLPVDAARGYQLFVGAAACATCHQIDGATPRFTDDEFHALSVSTQRLGARLADLTLRVAHQREQGMSVDEIVLSDKDVAELGRFVVTLNPADIGAFRTPSLRNVAETAPYMHDGSIATLEEAVDQEIYYRSGKDGHPLLLTPTERQDLVAFLKTLTTPKQEVLALAPSQRALPAPTRPGSAPGAKVPTRTIKASADAL
jgi:cytochrome c peroxidase